MLDVVGNLRIFVLEGAIFPCTKGILWGSYVVLMAGVAACRTSQTCDMNSGARCERKPALVDDKVPSQAVPRSCPRECACHTLAC